VSGRRLRPVDLAREHGLSAQAVRNYEEEGILPTAGRTRHGYRVYTPLHSRALRVFVALVPAHGHRTASDVMRAVNAGDVDGALTLLDESHVQLLRDRETLAAVDAALRDLASSEAGSPSRRGVVFIGRLARDLGVGPATLRKWEKAGLIGPRRDPETGYRVYGAEDVRDARLAHQLRRGGYLLRQIAPLIEQVRHAGGVGPLEATLDGWRAKLTTRGLSMLAAAAELSAYVEYRGHPSSASPPA
jgi:DNA-binding transcriptional MerR regulator